MISTSTSVSQELFGKEDGGGGEQAALAGQEREREHDDGDGRDQRADPAHELQRLRLA